MTFWNFIGIVCIYIGVFGYLLVYALRPSYTPFHAANHKLAYLILALGLGTSLFIHLVLVP